MRNTTLILLLVLLVATSYASETRNRGLGYISNYMDDDVNILNFPGTLSDYRNLSILEMDYINEHGSITANYYSKDLDLDFSLLLEKDLNLSESILDYYYPPDKITSIMFGRNHTAIYFGAAGVSTDEDSEDSYTVVHDKGGFYFITGIGRSFGESDLALHFQYSGEKRNTSYSSPSEISESNLKGYDTRFVYRFKRPLKNGIIRPYFEVEYQLYNLDSRDTEPTSFSNDDTFIADFGIRLGVAYEKKLSGNSTLWIGIVPINYNYYVKNIDRTNDYDVNDATPGNADHNDSLVRSNTSILFLAFESKITNWLTWRTGMRSTYKYRFLDQSRYISGGYYSSIHNKSFFDDYYVYYGLSSYYKNFTLDATVSPDLLYNGPQFITGQNSPFIRYLSLSYKW